ncbi:MAG: hypothetical protein EZS28_051640, partial [Streblomastix strix]
PNGIGWQNDATFISYMREIVTPGIVCWRNQTSRVIDEHNQDLKSKKEKKKSDYDREERSLLIMDCQGSRKNREPLDCGVNTRLKQRMREVFKYPKDNSVSFRAAFVEALKTAVNQALDSEVLKV